MIGLFERTELVDHWRIMTVAERTSAKEAARDMVATVSQWVNEFQQKRRSETAQAIKTLFADATPQTSKA